jgi:hypothetical protein
MAEIKERVVWEVSRRSQTKHPPHPSPGHAGPGAELPAGGAGRQEPDRFRQPDLEPGEGAQRQTGT